MNRRLLAPLLGLLFSVLSCAVTPIGVTPARDAALEATAAVETPQPAVDSVTVAPVPAEPDPSVAAVLAHLLRYQERTGLTLPELAELADTIVVEAQRHRLDPALVLAVMHVESRYYTYAVSPKDALGLMQLLPSTGKWLAPSVGVEWRGPQTLFDPTVNVRLGVAYLRRLMDHYDGSVRTALLAYNWGPGRIDQRLRNGTPLPREYAQLVLAAYPGPDRS